MKRGSRRPANATSRERSSTEQARRSVRRRANVPVRSEAPQLSWAERVRSAVRAGNFPRVNGEADGLLFGAVVALIVFGVVMVYSASSVRAVRMHGDGHHFLIRQALYAAVGLPLLFGLSRVDYHVYRPLARAFLLCSFALMLVVALGFGRTAGGATRWIQLGPVNIQPSEVAKVGLILWLSDSLARKAERVRQFSVGFVPHMSVVGLLVVLCMAQPDFGSSVILVVLTYVLLFVAGAKASHLLLGAAVALPPAYWALRSVPWRWKRIIAFTDPFEYRTSGGYQIVESWLSFGAGGATGVGLGDSRQKLLFLPEAHTDFIAAIVAEELGFVGFSLMVSAFVIVVVRGLRGAFRAPEPFGAFLGVGLSMFIGIQAVTNLAVVLGLLPTKGLTLPFVSSGGSSLLVNCAAVGVLLNLSRPRSTLVDVDPSTPAVREPRGRGKSARAGAFGSLASEGGAQ